jgi:hypothetical protein
MKASFTHRHLILQKITVRWGVGVVANIQVKNPVAREKNFSAGATARDDRDGREPTWSSVAPSVYLHIP